MKTMTCKELGGKCDQKLSAGTWDQMVQAMTKHVMEKHPEPDGEMGSNAPSGLDEPRIDMGTHGMNPMRVLQMARALGGSGGSGYAGGGTFGRILLVGCEPETLGSEEEGQMGLSATVSAAVDTAADTVEALVESILVGSSLEETRGAPGKGAAA
jgi:hypothetical protein